MTLRPYRVMKKPVGVRRKAVVRRREIRRVVFQGRLGGGV